MQIHDELKIKIMNSGVKISPEVSDWFSSNKLQATLYDYCTTSGIVFEFPNTNVFVNADFSSEDAKKSEIELNVYNNEFYISYEHNRYPVKVYPAPAFFDKKNKKGILYKDFLATHADRARISPIVGCAYKCKFCDFNTIPYQKFEINALKDAVQVAIDDPVLPAKHLLISGGSPKPEDREYLLNVFLEIGKWSPIPIDIMVAPWVPVEYIKKFKETNINELSVNIEIWDEEIAKKNIASKNGLGREHYLEFLKEAVKVYGKNNVRSILLVGLEPLASTLEGIEKLAEIGVSPVLSPFIPAEGTELSNHPRPTYEDLVYVWEKSSEIVKKYGVKMGPNCIPCMHNALTFSDGSSFYHYN
jgi:radical SAM superfamily enzyme YgiQ (UPF0313 family)